MYKDVVIEQDSLEAMSNYYGTFKNNSDGNIVNNVLTRDCMESYDFSKNIEDVSEIKFYNDETQKSFMSKTQIDMLLI